ncbi:MAG: DUF4136 domain-containing protein [Helicobacter sp.]|uniref:DUF4136 domain-containing protein n=1 Tax=Helicobacter sp. TaxID=218 RepID=UPI0025BABB8D|nr:DUF4136 domain-containing protein [Helicobacter sp.]MCH5313240.1 DUF4136 domain-containing protein [Helicobacter sp.]
MRILLCILCSIFVGCAILKPVDSKIFADISGYKYAIIGQTQTLSSSVGGGFIDYATGGGINIGKSINPSDVITGILIKKGLVIVDKPKDSKTLLVKYGQGDKRNVLGGLGGYTLEVSIQMLDALTQEPLFLCTAEGQGSTEADDLREAITRCLGDFNP